MWASSIVFYSPSADNEIGVKMFYRCEPLREIILPKTTTVIAGHAFDNCTSLAKCTFSAGLTTIRQYAFRNTKLTNVELPSTLTAMEAKVFRRLQGTDDGDVHKQSRSLNARRAVPELPETQKRSSFPKNRSKPTRRR